MANLTICEFNKNSAELVRISLVEFKGKKYVDFRIYYDASEGVTPDWRPSKKGICLSVDLLDELKEAIGRVEACVEDGGQSEDEDSAAEPTREDQGKETA